MKIDVKENIYPHKMGVCRRSVMTYRHPDTTSMVLLYRMARTRGGRIARPVAPSRVYMMPNGVKVRRMDGDFGFNPHP